MEHMHRHQSGKVGQYKEARVHIEKTSFCTYTSAVDQIIDSTKGFDGCIDKRPHTFYIRNIERNGKSLIIRICSVLLALLGGSSNVCFTNISKHNGGDPSLSKRKRGFFANPRSSLIYISVKTYYLSILD
jgi:hypothetical protein